MRQALLWQPVGLPAPLLLGDRSLPLLQQQPLLAPLLEDRSLPLLEDRSLPLLEDRSPLEVVEAEAVEAGPLSTSEDPIPSPPAPKK